MGDAMSGLIQNTEENTLNIANLYKRLLSLEKENAELKDRISSLEKNK